MHLSTTLISSFQRDRETAIQRSRLVRIAECARSCCAAPANLIDRFARALRPAAQSR